MRLKNVPGARELIENSAWCLKEPEKYRGNWKKEVFQNDHPLYLEIGTGRGKFLIDSAISYPQVNFLGIELYSSVLCKAVEKLDEIKEKTPEQLPRNLFFLSFDATYVDNLFIKEEVDRIYLNFSDPWPKERHAKRRLTSTRFLKRYERFLKKDGELHFKTDNALLFTFSIEELRENDWQLLAKTDDLHNDEVLNQGNIMTEYERRFSGKGAAIHKLVTAPPH